MTKTHPIDRLFVWLDKKMKKGHEAYWDDERIHKLSKDHLGRYFHLDEHGKAKIAFYFDEDDIPVEDLQERLIVCKRTKLPAKFLQDTD